MCLVSLQYFQQHVQVLYNDFAAKETICIGLQSMLVHFHLKTNWRIYSQHYNGLIHRGHCCCCEMKHVFVSISVYLSVILKWENSGAVLYQYIQFKYGHSIPFQVSNLLLEMPTTFLCISYQQYYKIQWNIYVHVFIPVHLATNLKRNQNDFTNEETIFIVSQSMLIYRHLQTDYTIYPQHYNGQMERYYCCFNWLQPVFWVHISVFICTCYREEELCYSLLLGSTQMWILQNIPRLQFVAGYFNNTLEHR